MGRKTKFIDKGSSQKYHLLHRSQTDSAIQQEGVPSEFVLVASSANSNQQPRVSSASGDESRGVSQLLRSSLKRDHITADGFKNDGYDYSQHLKEMGGGSFIPKGSSVPIAAPQYGTTAGIGIAAGTGSYKGRFGGSGAGTAVAELPEEALPSGHELERNLEAVTIAHDLMDEDLRAALFGEEDEDGEAFEELDDDFVMQVLEEPEVPDFDFDAHIANLIAKSEMMTVGVHKARGWDSSNSSIGEGFQQGTAATKPRKAAPSTAAPAEISEEGEEEEEESDGEDYDSDFEAKYASYNNSNNNHQYEEEVSGLMGRSKGAGGRAQQEQQQQTQRSTGLKSSAEKRALIEAEFEDFLDEYADEQLGYISEADEEEVDGTIDLDEDHLLLRTALDEVLQEERDLEMMEGAGERRHRTLKELAPDPDADKPAPSFEEVDVAGAVREQALLQTEAAILLESDIEESEEEEAEEEEEEEEEGGESKVGEITSMFESARLNALGAPKKTTAKHADLKGNRAELGHGLRGKTGKMSKEERRRMAAQQEQLEMMNCQEYLRVRNPKHDDDWDCESVLSLLSTTENRPQMIKSENKKFRPYKSHYARKVETMHEEPTSVYSNILSAAAVADAAASLGLLSAGDDEQVQLQGGKGAVAPSIIAADGSLCVRNAAAAVTNHRQTPLVERHGADADAVVDYRSSSTSSSHCNNNIGGDGGSGGVRAGLVAPKPVVLVGKLHLPLSSQQLSEARRNPVTIAPVSSSISASVSVCASVPRKPNKGAGTDTAVGGKKVSSRAGGGVGGVGGVASAIVGKGAGAGAGAALSGGVVTTTKTDNERDTDSASGSEAGECEEREEEGEGEERGEGSSDQGTEVNSQVLHYRRNKAETAEERRARKAAVKAEQRAKREQKRNLKAEFSVENKRAVKASAQAQSTDRYTMFKYSSS